MFSTVVERLLPYSAEQLFDVVADIERYPEFLPWWQAARVRERGATNLSVVNTVAIGPLRMQFPTEARLDRPRRLEVSSHEPPFECFRLGWQFSPQSGGGCRVVLETQLQMRSVMLQVLLERATRGLVTDVLAAFEARARALYPKP